jgi:hypothetical protein
MGTIDLETLNDKFTVADTLSFRNGAGDIPIAEIKNRYAAATIFLLGGHVTAFQPLDQQPVLWVRFGEVFRSAGPGLRPIRLIQRNHPTALSEPGSGASTKPA